MSTTSGQNVGALGEAIAVNFLIRKGFLILDRNYRKPWGELDIICKKDSRIIFVEVKSVSRETKAEIKDAENFRPEDNMHQPKIERLHRTIQTYLTEKHLEKLDWRLDLVTVTIDFLTKSARCKHISGVY